MTPERAREVIRDHGVEIFTLQELRDLCSQFGIDCIGRSQWQLQRSIQDALFPDRLHFLPKQRKA